MWRGVANTPTRVVGVHKTRCCALCRPKRETRKRGEVMELFEKTAERSNGTRCSYPMVLGAWKIASIPILPTLAALITTLGP